MMTWLALWAIGFYQRHISPYKGFRCAYRAHTGRAGCSALGKRAVRRYGFWRGVLVLDARLHKCGVAYRRYQAPRALAGQAGFLDCDCAGCDMPGSCDLPGDCGSSCKKAGSAACDILSCGCDWPRRRSRQDEYVVIPPRKGRRNSWR